MFKFLYNFSIHLFVALLFVLRLFNGKIKRMVDGRKEQQKQWSEFSHKDDPKRVICVHCASLGEFEQGRSLIEDLRKREPGAKIVVTFFSPSGYDIRKNYAGADAVYYLPFDTRGSVKRFLDAINPSEFYIIKYEFWYNLLSELSCRGVKVYLVSAIFRENSQFTANRWRGGDFYRSMLNFFTLLFVQDEASKQLLTRLGCSEDRCHVVGDTRFDRVAQLVESSQRIELVEEFLEGALSLTVVCGSTWPEDEELLVELMKNHADWRFIVAPHEISQINIEKMIQASGRVASRYSSAGLQDGSTLLVIDTIGLLSSVYRYADITYIGGGFGAGIHNTLEAATWGKPIVFGAKYHNFKEARDMVELGAAKSITSYAELEAAFADYSENYVAFGVQAREYVMANIGATGKILNKTSQVTL